MKSNETFIGIVIWGGIILLVIFFNWAKGSSESSYSGSSSGGTYGRYDEYTDYSGTDDRVTSENWVCTDDCGGHESGYAWAEENGITDPDDCGGNSDSFIEGCEAYANEYQQELEEEMYEDDYDYYR